MRTFISSTYEDLIPYRERVSLAIERLGLQGVRMEVFGARPAQAADVCFDEIKTCDVFLGIYAHRYGFVPPGSDRSITEMELDYAIDLTLPTFCYLLDDDYPWIPRHIDADPARSKLIAFKGRVSSRYVRDKFTTADDLAFKVASALGRFMTTQKIKDELTRSAPVQLSLLDRDQVARRSARLADVIRGSQLLIVNDIPHEMDGPIRIFEELKIDVEIAESTSNAMSWLGRKTFDVVVSDMTRGNEGDAGLRLLKEMRASNLQVPLIFTVGRYKPELGTPAHAFGITNRVDDLINLVFDALERRRG